MAENTGQRIARPTPLTKVSSSSSGAVSAAGQRQQQASSTALAATQICVAAKYRRRSTMSAIAPLGRPSRNTGSVDAVCTSATHTGLGASEVISQAAATSFIHMVTLAASQASHSMRKTGLRSGSSAWPGPAAGAFMGPSIGAP